MIGLIDVGGGNRGSYGCGVLDRFLSENIHISYGIGVSAGSANLASYFSGQKGRNYQFYTKYNLRKEAISLHNLIHKKNMVDMEYIYGTITNKNGENPLDFNKILKSDCTWWIVATDAETGLPVYFNGKDMVQDDFGALKASSNVPVVNKPYAWRNGLYYDGGISDPIPVEKALRDGCDKVIVILTRPKDYFRTPGKDIKLAKFIRKKYPEAADDLARRADVYNSELVMCHDMEKEGKVKIIAPDSTENMKTLSKDALPIRKLYHKGWHDAENAFDFIFADNFL
ncbi:MAG: patatin-like phospholipase family protein [Bilifractor sp.]|jgi:predicted patatin/cPLA2 family phospholipase